MDHFLQHREQEKCSLAVETLRSCGDLRLRASGVSMLPTLIPGDLLLIRSSTLLDVTPGDIVLYQREGSLFVHRLIAVDSAAPRFTTRGDSMAAPDPEGANCLLGKVITIDRNGRLRAASRRLGTIARLAGLLLCHSARVRNLFLRWKLNGARSTAMANRSATVSQ